MKYKMKGVIPPMITPFIESGELDEQGLRTLLRFLREHVTAFLSAALMAVAR